MLPRIMKGVITYGNIDIVFKYKDITNFYYNLIKMLLSLFYCLITTVDLLSSSVSNFTGLNEPYTLFNKHLIHFKNKCHLTDQKKGNQIYNSNVKRNAALFQSILLDNGLKSRQQRRSSCSRQKRNLSKRQKRSSNSDIYRRSLCPWTNVWDMDTERSPLFIPKAKCSSRKCSFNFTELVMPEIIEVLTSCEPLTTDIRIYKNNEETYVKDWPVACACSRRVVSKDFTIRNKGIIQNIKNRTERNHTGLKKSKKRKKKKKVRKRKKLYKGRRHKMRRKGKKVKKRRCWRFKSKGKRKFFRKFPCSFRSKRQKYVKGLRL